MTSYIKFAIYLVVFFGFSVTYAGSYDDFFAALQRDNSHAVRALLEHGFDPNTPNPEGELPLMQALREPAPGVASLLLEHPGTHVDVRNAKDETPLMLAALKGYRDLCLKLIERDADVNKTGWAPLHYAATGGHVEVMQLLLDNHAYIDAASPNGSTPLMMAARYSTASAVKMLLESGADPSLKNDLNLTAIDFARSLKKEDAVDVLSAAIRARLPKGSW